MSKQRQGLVPELRFSGFSEPWKVKALAPYLKQHSKKVRSSTELDVFSSTREGLKSQNEYFDGSKLANEGEYGVVPEGYFVYRHMSDDNIFKFNINQLGKQIAVSKEYPVFKTENLDPGFLLNVLNEGSAFKVFAASQKKGGTRTRLYFKTLGTFVLPLPSLQEQQKIADCLASIDELIALYTQKLDSLKDHKKGLMQQLFPAEGETVPKLRFSEFKGDWVEVMLGQAAKYENGKAHEQHIDARGQYIVVNSKFISTSGEIRKFSNSANLLAEKDDILMVLSDVPNGRAIAKCFYVDKDEKYTVNQRICKLTAKKGYVSKLLYYVIDKNPYFLAFDDGVKQTNLKKDDVLNCPLWMPNDIKEQKKIVGLLDSIDDAIFYQEKKLLSLKSHKAGLLQKLFPVMDDVVS